MNDIQKNTKSIDSAEKKSGQMTGINSGSMETDEKNGGTGLITRIFAILGLVIIVGLYILSLDASIADWENSFGIFTGALAATIFVPIVIYLFKLFSNRNR